MLKTFHLTSLCRRGQESFRRVREIAKNDCYLRLFVIKLRNSVVLRSVDVFIFYADCLVHD